MPQNRTMTEGVNIRLPNGMRDRLRRFATANHRSVTSQIVHFLDHALAAEEQKGPAGAATPPGHGFSNTPITETADERADS